MENNPFLKPVDFYQRKVDPLKDYVTQNTFYLSKMSGKDPEVCREFIVQGIKSKAFPEMRNPTVHFFERGDNGDKEKTSMDLYSYISTSVRNNYVLAPTFTCYVSADEQPSLVSEFADDNKKIRNKAKKEMFVAKAEGKSELYILKDNEQNNAKLSNNSLSGCFGASGSVLYNETGHNTLTSIVRCESSISNASNEKIISGNRHYFEPAVVLNNLISITSSIDTAKLTNVITKYNLVYPSKQDVVDVIKYSSDFYWRDERAFEKIYAFIDKLTDVERAAFVYIGDLYHIRKFNDGFIRQFLTDLSRKVTNQTFDDPISIIHSNDEQVVNFAHHICMKETQGKGKDYSIFSKTELDTLAATSLNITNSVIGYIDFIDAFFLTENQPVSTAYIPGMVRRCVVLSDTDSTMFSADEFVIWYFGSLTFSDEQYAIATSIMYLATQCIAHLLAMMSANLGISKRQLFQIAMKPEFTFPVFAQTSVAKHYFTCTLVREGNVFNEPELEVKGVNLKNSASPKMIIKEAQAKMNDILNTIRKGEQLSIIDELNNIARIERGIIDSLLNGNVEYFKQSKVKNAEAYVRDAESSPYMHYTMWCKLFEPKYGAIAAPPYSTIKIPTIVNNITALNKWIANIEDKEFAGRLADWLVSRGKKDLPTIYLPINYVKSYGLPVEVKQVMDIKSIVLDLTYVFRATLETMGYFPKQGWMISEMGY